MKQKTCAHCRAKFMPAKPLQMVCGWTCGLALIQSKKLDQAEKAAKAERKADKANLKTRGDWLREAQAAFNSWVRKRDEMHGCISCGTNNGKMNAGHYRSVGANPELRFEELNVWKQCERCNTFLHGNLLGYRAGLKSRISDEALDWLEGFHEAKKYSLDDLKAIKAKYKARTKELQA